MQYNSLKVITEET